MQKKIKAANCAKNIVISDVRFKNEARVLSRLGFTLIDIVRNSRVIDRDPMHISEIELDNYNFNYILLNNGTIPEFEKKTDDLIKKLLQK